MSKKSRLLLNYKVACHTDNIVPGGIFVAISGTKLQGLDFIPQALAQGAKTIVVEIDQPISHELAQLIKQYNATLIYTDNARKSLAQLSAQAHDHVHKKLKIISATGTKGKTTTCFLIEHILKSAGKKVALISSVYNRIGDMQDISQHATPQPDYLHAFFALCVEQNVEYVVLETAAQAHTLYRIEGLSFDAVVFTNFAQEHGEFYATMHEYFAAKCAILQHAKSNAPIFINADNEWCINVPPDERHVFYSLQGERLYDCPALTGVFNMYNVLAATCIVRAMGVQDAIIQQALQTFKAAPGRMEKYALPNGAYCFIDYAHNPSSYTAVLQELRARTPHLIAVFGAGGERESSKRPIMGSIAAQYVDDIILTTDNPRSEQPEKIMQDILAGIEQKEKVTVEFDRQKAIELAYMRSKKDSYIVLLGKGNDEYQIIQGVKYPFSERAIIAALKPLQAGK